jgi:DNA-binding response OmpR family regulator
MGKHKLLVIEDDVDLAVALKDSLSERGFNVTAVNTGEEGVQLIKSESFDIVLLDWLLPGMSGLEVLKEVDEVRQAKRLPVIILSNVDNPDDIKAAREYEIAEYLVKTDWRLDDVVQKIKGAL